MNCPISMWAFVASRIAFMLCLPISLIAQSNASNTFQFQHLTESDGLADNFVHCSLLDKRGFMWFGTHDGLSRWDGLEFKNFYPRIGDTASIAGSLITSMMEDKKGYIWMVSHQGDLCRFDPTKEIFKTFPYPKFEGDIHINAEMKIFQDSEEILWIGSYSDGFLRFDPQTEKYKHYNLHPRITDLEKKFSQNSVLDFIEDIVDVNILWIAANNGLYRFNKKTEELAHFPSSREGTEGTAVYALLMSQPNYLWLGTYGAGVVKFDKQTHLWEYFTPNPTAWKELSYGHNMVLGLAQKSAEELWVNSKDNGAGIFNISTKTFSFFKDNKTIGNPINGNSGWGVYVDKKERVWFFMEDNGISYLDPKFQNFTFYPLKNRAAKDRGLFETESILYQPDRQKLMVLGNGGIYGCYETDLKGQIQQVIPLQPLEERKIQTYQSLYQAKDGQIWVVGNHARGLAPNELVRPPLLKMEANRKRFMPYQSADNTLKKIQKENILSIIEDEEQHLWGVTANGLLFQLKKEGKVRTYVMDNPNQVEKRGYRTILKQKDKQVWLMASDRGVVNFDYQQEKFTLYPESEILDVRSIQDKQNKLWIASTNRGLQCLDLESKQLLSLETYKNVPRIPIDKVFLDTKNRLWCTTERGLYYLDESLKTFFHFGLQSGLTKDFFFFYGVNVLPNGDILLGQEGGFFRFNPDELLASFQSNQLVITDIRINETPYPLEQNVLTEPSLNLTYDENSIYLSFSTLTFSNQEKIHFAYQLEGIDKDWVIPFDNRNFALYNKIPPGNYTFKVKNLYHKEGKELQIPIQIAPPYYQTWWAYIFYTLAGISLIYAIYRFQLKRQAERQEAKKLKEIDELKTKLYANITHEFRTPLTLILGQANQIKKSLVENEISNKATNIEKNGKQLLRLVNQLLDLRKIAAKQEGLNLVQGDIVPVLNFITDSFESLAVARKIQYQVNLPRYELLMDYDYDKFQKILSNLIANAIKFSPNGGKVAVFAQKIEQQLLIIISDSGIGIAKADLPFIFDRFYRSEEVHHTSGTGIGLSLTKELVELLNGKITVESVKNKGSDFTVKLPISNLAPSVSPKEIIQDKDGEELMTMPATVPLESIKQAEDLPIVLIIEDNTDVAKFTASCLKTTYTIHFAKDGQEGIDKAKALIPDIIISDVMMPKKDVFAVCAILKQAEETAHIPVILLTARADMSDKLVGLERGADAYLTKPFHEAELQIRVQQLVRLREKLKERYAGLNLKKPSKDKSLQINDAFILKVRAIVEAQLDNEQFGVEELSKAIFLSRAQVHRKIKALTGKSTGQFIHTIRLHHALEIIQKTDKSITEIAFDVGYQDPSYFSRLFTREFGNPPTFYGQ